MIERYIEAAMDHATVEWIPDDEVYSASVVKPAGIWVEGESPEQCRARLRAAIEQHLRAVLPTERAIPPIDGVRLRPAPPDDVGLP